MTSEPTRRRGGRPTIPADKQKKILTERLEVKLSPEMKEWVLERGGGAYLRKLVTEDRERTETDGTT